MAVTYYLRGDVGIGCGPGTRLSLELVVNPGVGAATMDLDATGDTWNTAIPATGHASFLAGTWTVELYLRRAGFVNGSVRVTLSRFDVPFCTIYEQILQKTATVTTSSFAKYTFSATTGQVIFEQQEGLLCVVEELAGDTSLEFDQPAGGNLSIIITPAMSIINPWYVYANS